MRKCTNCSTPMTEGYCIENGCEYYCSDECLHEHYTEEEYLSMYDNGEGDSYWTEWEECKVGEQDKMPSKKDFVFITLYNVHALFMLLIMCGYFEKFTLTLLISMIISLMISLIFWR